VPGLHRTASEKRELESRNGALQFLLVVNEIEEWKPGQSRITPELLCSLQYRAIVNIYDCAGYFRNGAVIVKDGDAIVLDPPEWTLVPNLVDEMCRYVNESWEDRTPVHLAAYLIWRLNWIHPFFGGNGRTARAISYLALCARLGFRLPGQLTIPDQIVNRRAEYIAALRSADAPATQGAPMSLKWRD
jgi:fido (protein-threonine AMPylation protein)